jgi:hypothetical protein
MSTVRALNVIDPPQTSTNVVGFKRIRKTVTLLSGAGSLPLGDVVSCLPLVSPELRIVKLSCWHNDTGTLSVVFPVSNPPSSPIGGPLSGTPGDNSAWSDDGSPGAVRAQIHLTPNFEYRNYWLSTARNGAAAIIATFGSSGTGTLIVDVTLQYRTSVQTCPASVHLDYLLSKASMLRSVSPHPWDATRDGSLSDDYESS